MDVTTSNTSFSTPSTFSYIFSKHISNFTLHFSLIHNKTHSLKISTSLSNSSPTPSAASTTATVVTDSSTTATIVTDSSATDTSAITAAIAPAIAVVAAAKPIVSRFAYNEPRKGADILIEALERQGVTIVFAYPDGTSLEIHQALTRSTIIRNILPFHEQDGVFTTEGYARSSGLAEVCMSTSGPGATNLISGLADAMMDNISVVKEAFMLAISGRPGHVLIDIPKYVQQQLATPKFETPIGLSGYLSRLPKIPNERLLDPIVGLILESKKPALYVGGGCLNSSKELIRFVELIGIPVASTLMGLSVYFTTNEYSLQMLGMHGTVYANYAVENSDLLLAFGVRFDDHVTGKLEAFASRAKIVHIHIDLIELGKNKQLWVSVFADVKVALEGINRILEKKGIKNKFDFQGWREELNVQKLKFPLSYKTFGDSISPQNVIQILDELTNGNAIITTGVGQHQMWATQFYKYQRPRKMVNINVS
ncbi:hypothetical protein TanjilG_29351 [Lupinus angustifolius]|uniref:acetolactate synthase n=1 Tax=Lupinus angustifolius TaxID=3871 RepID=A0A1J7GSE1_LUPAN|nr:hypothetical protein TanjilG_29351 [Lupinus angustifolius]